MGFISARSIYPDHLQFPLPLCHSHWSSSIGAAMLLSDGVLITQIRYNQKTTIEKLKGYLFTVNREWSLRGSRVCWIPGVG